MRRSTTRAVDCCTRSCYRSSEPKDARARSPAGAVMFDDFHPEGRDREARRRLRGSIGAAVVIEAEHLCMRMRGVEKQNSIIITSTLLGAFRNRQETRAEFMNLIRSGG